ncbi:hypothetical protein HCA00_14350 [Listeria booriae]|uniref:Uncharacterized protein n=1 Tax=Listeria booriae TaxID=1552123 RepID=A0A841YRW6_9LIST|nr:hypothetical protein [Listeria booriae]MBC1334735.1 hypothetical protein [Listeria booriae]MBC1403136.1 hypothetical protein [Listeria booriae]MBC1617908.1 hypothetical protein [Listeria booriae]MBC1943608.1 hypothetical protein [Listeria booriae]MBC6129992.1 hypothetical protein [Listeria booriae]
MEKISNLKELEEKMEKNKYCYPHGKYDQRDVLYHLAGNGYIFVDTTNWKGKHLFLTTPQGKMICYLERRGVSYGQKNDNR